MSIAHIPTVETTKVIYGTVKGFSPLKTLKDHCCIPLENVSFAFPDG
jgi:hypothetical protein